MLIYGLQVFIRYLTVIIYILITTFGIGRLLQFVLTKLNVFSDLQHPIISINLGFLAIPLFIIPVILLSDTRTYVIVIGIIMFLISLCGIILARSQIHDYFRSDRKWQIIIFIILLILLFLRLGLLKDAIFPSYYDSVTHYKIVDDFFNNENQFTNYYSIKNILSIYYHFGFHTIVVVVVGLFKIPIAIGILLIGQIMLWIIGINLYFFINWIFDNKLLGVFSLLISTFAWQMPSFAVNWGKYPALSGIAFFPIIAIFIFSFDLKRKKIPQFIIIVFVTLLNVLFHSRVLFLILALIISFFASRFILFPKLRLLLTLLNIVVSAFLVLPDHDLQVLYIKNNVPLSIIFLVMLPLAIKHFPKYSFALLSFISLCLLFTKIPLFIEINKSKNSLLDNSFVTLVLFLPIVIIFSVEILSILRQFSRPMIYYSIIFIIIFEAVVTADNQTLFSPHPCCNYLNTVTITAIDWVKTHLSENDLIAISTTPMRDYEMPVDTGAWITTLTGKNAVMVNQNYLWNSTIGNKQSCDMSIDYVFVGGFPNSFSNDEFVNSTRYKKVFENNSVFIYQLVGCGN